MPSISGQSLLVIGGSSGIGASVAQLAVEQGVRVSIASSNPARVANAVAKIRSQSPETIPNTQIRGFTIDLAQPDVEQRLEQLLADATADASELLDHIVVTAGKPATRPLASTDRNYLFGQAQLILIVPILVAKLAPRFLKPSYTSSVVLCGGRLGDRPIKGWPTGAAYAAGLTGLTRALALDLAPLRINVVHPGPTETEIWGETPEKRKSVKDFHASTALLGKVGTPEEVAEAFVYLLRDSNITGTSINSSGGVLVQ
ncbi:Glucose/ribitol dehydrogenase [Penicillium nucicola]|uniref:Glucose/ribitol dehydrogenase n=1 Tax=Penicillium nucicola TaxID=1850975 RepID=UPI002544F46E|nr:Glucose/ribitol dehydrogenase [Penicillium nucicola]KAJ5761809.1 Glucose/ribitol dehydrogenase [Penicillium nucicola]